MARPIGVRGAVALVLIGAGMAVLLLALWILVTGLPDAIGASGTHAAGDTKLVLGIIGVPLIIVAVVLLGGGWAIAGEHRWVRRVAAVSVVAALATGLATSVAMVLPVSPPGSMLPPDAQRVRVSVSGNALVLEPSTVTVGTVHLLVDDTARDVLFISGMEDPASGEGDNPEEPWPLEAAQVDAIARGDTFHTSTTGGIGDLWSLELRPGLYVLALDSPEALAAEGGGRAPAGHLQVLTVVAAP